MGVFTWKIGIDAQTKCKEKGDVFVFCTKREPVCNKYSLIEKDDVRKGEIVVFSAFFFEMSTDSAMLRTLSRPAGGPREPLGHSLWPESQSVSYKEP